MDLIQEVYNLDKDIDDNIEHIDDKLSEYKSMIDIFLKTFSLEVVDFFLKKNHDIIKQQSQINKEINKSITINSPPFLKTEFSLINDIINFKNNFFNKNKYFFYFLYLTKDIKTTFFYIVVDKITTYFELNLVKCEVNTPEFSELLNKLSKILSENFDNKDFLLSEGIKKEIIVEEKYIDLIEKVNIFLDDKITGDKISDVNFLEKRLFELQNNRKKGEIIEKTNNLEQYFMEIKKIKQQIDNNQIRINLLKNTLYELNEVIQDTESIINSKNLLKRVDKMGKNNEISEYNNLIIKKETELKELKKKKNEELNYFKKDLENYLLKKKKIENNNELKILNEQIKYTFDTNKLDILKSKFKEITEEKYLDLILVNNKIDVINNKIEEVKNTNFKDLTDDIEILLEKRNISYNDKNLDILKYEKESLKKHLIKRDEIQKEIRRTNNEIRLLKSDYDTKNNKFKFKRVHFFKRNEELFKELSKLGDIIKEFEEYLKILKINLYNFQNNSKIVNNILKSNLSSFSNNLQINICYDNYSDIIQDCLNDLESYIKDILNFKYYNKLVYELYNFTSNCDKKLCNVTESLLNYNSYNNFSKIKNLEALNYGDKLDDIITKYEMECLNFDKDSLDNFIKRKKTYVDMKKIIQEQKNNLEIMEKIKCD
jgi:hypothetical protein